MKDYRWLLIGLLMGSMGYGCMSSHITWVNPEDPHDDGAHAKTLCDIELGLVGSPKDGSTADERGWSYRAFEYPQDLKRCMEDKGYVMGSSR